MGGSATAAAPAAAGTLGGDTGRERTSPRGTAEGVAHPSDRAAHALDRAPWGCGAASPFPSSKPQGSCAAARGCTKRSGRGPALVSARPCPSPAGSTQRQRGGEPVPTGREGTLPPPCPRHLPSATQRARGGRSRPPEPSVAGGWTSGGMVAAARGACQARGADALLPPGPRPLPVASLRPASSRPRQWRTAAASGGRRQRRPAR